MIPKIRVYIKKLNWMTEHISSINYGAKTVEVWLTWPDEWDPTEFGFDEVEIMRGIWLKDYVQKEVFEWDIIEYSQTDKVESWWVSKWHNFSIWQVFYRKDKFIVKSPYLDNSYRWNKFQESKIPNSPKNFRIVWNIYQNKDILEKYKLKNE